LGCLGPHQASRVDPNATRRSVAKATSSFARTAMAAALQAIWTSGAPSTSSPGLRLSLLHQLAPSPSGGISPGRRRKKRRHPSQSCDMQRTASWPHAAVLASSKGRLTSATRSSNEKPRRRWERRPGQVFAERVVTGGTDGRCSAERNIAAGAVRAVSICRLCRRKKRRHGVEGPKSMPAPGG
jgi:hypothetical protein